MQLCSVCTEQTPKYKCPACKIRYCSLVCYKTHKAFCTARVYYYVLWLQVYVLIHFTEPWSIEDLLHEDDLIDKVPMDKLQLLGQSKELQDFLCNPHLRQLLRSIDAAESKEDVMRAAMQDLCLLNFLIAA
uniref:Zinc finger HIT domain-containing protein 3 n=1 Tax=Neogobius melanostomus TaxID=47308 RepID=A0A8C6SA95_9GOBI